MSVNSNHQENKKICCIGAGYVGGPSMTMIAYKCPNLTIEVVDIDEKRIEAWNSENLSNLPVYEPGLSDIIKKVRHKNLFFSTNVKEAIASADIIFLSVNTPTKIKGVGSGKASNLEYLERSVREIACYSKGHTIIVEKSTVPVKTAETIKSILFSYLSKDSSNLKTYSIISNPEFLSEGSAIKDLESPDRVLIGGDDIEAVNQITDIYKKWVPVEKIIKTNLWSSELSKLAANAFLAQKVSSINSIGVICEETGADINEVAKAIGSDSRIGQKFLNAGPGFGGSCFKKDILSLVYICNFYRLDEIAKYWENVINLNDWQQDRISKLIIQKLFGTIQGKKIAIFGFAFKANTNDTRESPAIKISRNLILEGAHLNIYDPKVNEEKIETELRHSLSSSVNKEFKSTWVKNNSIEDSVKDADAVVILTEWLEFSEIKWKHLVGLMRKPSWIFDTRNILNKKDLEDLDINIWINGQDLKN
tara:strand:- start:179 stop:1609 length:1431 start_codon:yes stop_codon:yes gene_type:complete